MNVVKKFLLPIVIFAFCFSAQAAQTVLTVTVSGGASPPETPETPETPGGGGGGGGGGGAAAPVVVTGVSLSGRAFPLSRVTVLKDGQIAATTIAGPDAKFNVQLSGLATGNYTFSLYGEDNKKIRSASFTFPVFISAGALTTISGIFIAPTLAVDKAQVRRGDNLSIFGQTTPGGVVTIEVNSENQIFAYTNSDANGVYLYNFNSSPLTMGKHLTKSKAQTAAELSEFGLPVTFAVGTQNIPFNLEQSCSARGDLNHDCRVNLVDFSIAAYWYKKVLSQDFLAIERTSLSGDGLIDLRDFSIMAYYWTG